MFPASADHGRAGTRADTTIAAEEAQDSLRPPHAKPCGVRGKQHPPRAKAAGTYLDALMLRSKDSPAYIMEHFRVRHCFEDCAQPTSP